MPTGNSSDAIVGAHAADALLRGGSLRRKYAIAFVIVVTLPLFAYGVLSTTLIYRQQREALGAIQTAQADASAVRISQFLREIELQLSWLAAVPWTDDVDPQRRLDAIRVMRQAPAITDLVLVDGKGRERVAESRLELSRMHTLADRSASPAFAGAMAQRVYRGDVYFRKGTEPYMAVAVAGQGLDAGVAIAEVNLKHIWDVVSRIQIAHDGIAYVVDRAGRLIAHPDINLVLRNTDLSQLIPEFEQAAATADAPRTVRMLGTRGEKVLASSATIAPVGWRVIVEQPEYDADEPVRTAVRGALWVAAFSLLFALAAALWSAWRMARPLRELSTGAARIGAGQLSHRIELRTGDELEQLGARFNAMADELEANYRTLEAKVDERTRELAEANRAKSRLLAAASHDLRQPLHALNLLVAQAHGERDPVERERLSRRVEAAIASINALFDGLLDVSKLDAGVVRPEVEAFPVQRILDRMDIAFSAAASAKGLEMRVRANPAWVCSDPVLLERIVGNLVANAVRYTREGAVLVGCRRAAGGVRITVCDTGIGIAPDKLDEVFQEFYQVSTTGAAREGLGLGLSIVARLSELLGHAVGVRSTPGRGSCFSVTVDNAAPQTMPSAEPTGAGLDALAGRRVLVIDNSEQVLESTVGLLRHWGCDVKSLGGFDGRMEASIADAAWMPELVVVDMHLDHGDDGLSIVRRVRASFGENLPAIVVTGDVSTGTREAIAAADLPALEKPVSALRLRAALTLLVQRD